jgi:hypothetical protein
MKIKHYIPFFLLAFFLVTLSCNTTKAIQQEKEESTSFLSQDKLGNIYQIGDMKIVKFSSELDTIQSNSIFSSGAISSIDTRNPLQLMLFYKQQQEIQLLDNTLSQTNKINLQFFEWIDLACMSNRDNAFWLYSMTTQTLIKTDKNGKVVSRYNNIGQLVQRDILPTQLTEYNNQVYLFDPNQGMFVFDLFGNYTKRVELKNAEIIKFYQNKVFFRVKNDIFSYNLVSFDKKLEFSSNHNFDYFEVGNGEVLVLKDDKIKKAISN